MTDLEVNVKPVTAFLLLACIIVFIIELVAPGIIPVLAFSADNFFNNPLVMISSAFLHGGVLHLVYNSFSLFFLGTALEDEAGSKFMTALFFLSVLIANLAFALLFPESSAIGISGFIYGLIGSLILIKPSLRVLMPLGLYSAPMPVIIAGPLLALGEFLLSFTSIDGVAHVAHFGGFIAGLALGFIERLKKSRSLTIIQ